jgi:hypothetical protein
LYLKSSYNKNIADELQCRIAHIIAAPVLDQPNVSAISLITVPNFLAAIQNFCTPNGIVKSK